MRDAILDRALQIRGTVKKIADRCGISTAAVSQWRRVPASKLRIVAEITGIPREVLRPDLAEGAPPRKRRQAAQ